MHLHFKILKHKYIKDHMGIISNGILYSSNSMTPQLYPPETNLEDIERILLLPNQRNKLKSDFELKDVMLIEGKSVAAAIIETNEYYQHERPE